MKEEEAQRKAEAAAERKRRKEEQVKLAQTHALPATLSACTSQAMHGTALARGRWPDALAHCLPWLMQQL